MGQFKLPKRGIHNPVMMNGPMMGPPPPGSPEFKRAIDGAKAQIQAQKDIADLIAQKIVSKRKLRYARAKADLAEIAHLEYEHQTLVKQIEMQEKGIAAAENQGLVVKAVPAVTLT